jgi:hypothetical protein
MAGIPEISGPQERERERERNVENNPQREHLDQGDVHSPKWGTQFPGKRMSCNLAIGFSRK